jgi:tRNA nucleotidyltransferase (CCA-adding enzyme)
MQKDLRRLMLSPNLLPSKKQTLLSNIATQASSLKFPCYVVGGFVRDLLLGRPVNDLDVIVEGDAIKLGKALVKTYGGKLTPHPLFHTAIWHLPETWNLEPGTLDLITARKETYSTPGALPTVTPSTIEDDLRRRDFTINAMAVRIDGDHFGELLDPLNGQTDLERGVIRVLHSRSFIDDPTRIFRAVRYAARYSFSLHPSSLSLINAESLSVLSTLSGERLRHELDLILAEENAQEMLLRVANLGLLGEIHFALKKVASPIFPAFTSNEYDRTTILYLLWLVDLSAEDISSVAERLDFTADLKQSLLSASQLKINLPTLSGSKPSAWTFAFDKYPPVSIYAVHLVSHEQALMDYLSKWRHIKPVTTGNDLKERGIPPGPRYKEILSALRAAWLDGEVKTQIEEKELLNSLL